MTRDEGLLISLEKEPHNWESVLPATHVAPTGEKYLQFRHKPTNTILNANVSNDESSVKISLSQVSTNNQHYHSVFGTNPILLPSEHDIIKHLMYIKELAELEISTETRFPFLSHVENL